MEMINKIEAVMMFTIGKNVASTNYDESEVREKRRQHVFIGP